MRYSTYQVERVLERLRRWRYRLRWPAHERWRGADPVRLSRWARDYAAYTAEEPRREPWPAGVTHVREPAPLEAPVEAERERRAGSFLQPPYPEQPPPQIPKRGPPPVRRPLPRELAEGD